MVLVVVTIALYYPVHGHPFVKYDDDGYVYENHHVQTGLSWTTVNWAFRSSYACNWHPLTWLTHAAVCQFFGLNPAAHHDINVLLHTVNVVVLFWVLLFATGYAGRSFTVAALFALHPINVESVAWVAELKTLLSTLFFLLALGAYGWYARQPRRWRMALVFLAFALGLMAKPQIITFPFVLLLWDYWPLRRLSTPWDQDAKATGSGQLPQASLRALLGEKMPLFVLAAASAFITMTVQQGARHGYPRSYRVGNAVLSYGMYLRDAIWPSRLALLYPHPVTSLRWTQAVLSGLILLGVSIWIVFNRKHRYLVVGWLWFVGTLVPMLGIVQVGIQARADRYAYVSFLGLFILACWGVADFAQSKRLSTGALAAVSVVALLSLALVARRQIDYWRTEEGLWRHVLQVTNRNWVAEGELAADLSKQHRGEEAAIHYNAALAINPEDDNSNMGIAIYDLLQRRDLQGAIAHYNRVVANPNKPPSILARAYLGLARAYHDVGDHSKSQEYLLKAKAFSSE